jgi:predicted nucleic acid-binding protein
MVINSGSLILLDKIDALEIAGALPCRFVCPPAVRKEIDAGIHHNHSPITPGWLTVKPLISPISQLADLAIDQGEAEVIQLALENNVGRVCLDDLRGRKIAKRVGLRVTGLLGLLAWAKESGVIPRMRSFTERMIAAGGRYSRPLIDNTLADMGIYLTPPPTRCCVL